MNPKRLRERLGVSTAEKIAGSELWSLSDVMTQTIPQQ
jgi:hypothetical protein